MSDKRCGFTLAEVLITLGIIGVVAALTIPALMHYTFEREAVSKVKKTYSMLAQAVANWQNDNNCAGDSYACPEYDVTIENNGEGLARSLSKYMKYAEVYYSPSAATLQDISWIPDKAYFMNGTRFRYDECIDFLPDKDGDTGWLGFFKLDDGVTLMIGGIHHGYNVVIDINGNKKPNRNGKDIFVASFGTGKSYYPTFNPYAVVNYWGGSAGYNMGGLCMEGNPAINKLCNSDDGHSPTAYVLAHDKLPNLTAMGYPASP